MSASSLKLALFTEASFEAYTIDVEKATTSETARAEPEKAGKDHT